MGAVNAIEGCWDERESVTWRVMFCFWFGGGDGY